MNHMNDKQPIKVLLKRGESIVGPFARIQDPAAIEILGYGGFDFGIIDLEHGPASIHQVENLVRAAKLVGLSPIVRIRENSQTMIQRALDAGALGVQIPQINNAEMAREAVRSAKFHPMGERGVCRFTRSAQYSHIPKEVYFDKANDESLVILQVEGLEGVKNIDEILEVDGFDVLFIGPYDLSQALGIPGQVENSKVIETMVSITKKAKEKGVAVGAFADNLNSVKRFIDMDLQYLSFGIDTGIFYEATTKVANDVKNLIEDRKDLKV